MMVYLGYHHQVGVRELWRLAQLLFGEDLVGHLFGALLLSALG